MYNEINKLYLQEKDIREQIKKKHTYNKRDKKIVKMLEHFNDRLKNLEKLNNEKDQNVMLCNFILADLKEMMSEIKKQTQLKEV